MLLIATEFLDAYQTDLAYELGGCDATVQIREFYLRNDKKRKKNKQTNIIESNVWLFKKTKQFHELLFY